MGCVSSNEKDSKILVITGATGQQGGSIIDILLKHRKTPQTIRAITRNPNSEKAIKLQKLGVQVIKADLDDVESLTQAFDGAYGVFCLTNFMEHFSSEKEKQQALNLATACQKNNVQHAIWSTLDQTKNFMKGKCPVIQGDYTVPHFDGKNDANQYFIDLKVPTTFLYTSAYYENFIHYGMGPQKQADGNYAISLNLGDAKMPIVSLQDLGKMVAKIFTTPSLIGQDVYVSSQNLTLNQIAQEFSEVLQVPVSYNKMSNDQYRSLGYPGCQELGNMFQFYTDNEEQFCSKRDIKIVESYIGKTMSLRQFIQQNKSAFKVEKPTNIIKKKILLFAASASDSRINYQFLQYVQGFLGDYETTLFDLKSYLVEDIYVQGKETQGIPENVKKFSELLSQHDGIILSLAEHNFFVTTAWKNMLDWLSRYAGKDDPQEGWKQTFQNKPMLLTGTTPAPMGPSQTILNASQFYPYLGAKVSGFFHFHTFYQEFIEGKLKSQENQDLLLKELKKFQDMIN